MVSKLLGIRHGNVLPPVDDDWHSWVIKVLDEYWNEYAWMDMMFRELWP
jgi:hypothetical protein